MVGQIKPQQQQLSITNESVKKCRGNQRLQRFRRKYRARGINQHELEILVNIHQTIESLHQNNLPTINNGNSNEKDQNDLSIINTTDSINSLSIFMENQEYSNELQTTEENLIVIPTDHPSISLSILETGDWISPQKVKNQISFKRYNLSNDHCRQYSKLIQNYRNLSFQQFKNSFMKSIPMHDRPIIERLLNNFHLLQSLQNRAELIRTISRLKIEHNYWNYVLNLLTTPIDIWLSDISKNIIKENSLNWDHTKTKINIDNRQAFLKIKLNNAQNMLEMHLSQADSWYWSTENKSKPHIFNIITKGLDVLIENSLYYFRLNFEQKLILLKYDITEAYLIDTIQKIWKSRVKSMKRAACQKKKNHSLSIKTLSL